MRRFTQLWDVNATRELPVVVDVGRRLAEELPEPLAETVVHGDYRLGNLMLERDRPDRVEAVLDWEMGAIGDPRADLGYLLATYAEPGGAPSPLGVTPVTALEGFPVEGGARRSLRRPERPRGRAARLVRGARALEGRGLLRGDLRALPARRARRRGHERGGLRDGRAAHGGDRGRRAGAVVTEHRRPAGSIRPGFAEADWNERYAGRELVWTAEPNRLFAAEVAELRPGGRSTWRAARVGTRSGSPSAGGVSRAWTSRPSASRRPASSRLHAASRSTGCTPTCSSTSPSRGRSTSSPSSTSSFRATSSTASLRRAATAVARGGTLLVLGHDTTNLTDGHGGPKDVSVLFTPEDVVASLGGLVVERAEKVRRTVSLDDGREAIAIDAFVRARRPIEPS